MPRNVIFISYRRADSAVPSEMLADKLELALTEHEIDAEVFIDRDIAKMTDWRQHLDEKLGHTTLMLAVIGRAWAVDTVTGRKRLFDDDDVVKVLDIAARQDTRLAQAAGKRACNACRGGTACSRGQHREGVRALEQGGGGAQIWKLHAGAGYGYARP